MTDETVREARSEIDTGLLRPTRVTAVQLSPSEALGFYERYSNRVLRSVLCGTRPSTASGDDWMKYRTVNERFAETIAREVRAGDIVWVHDYPLMLVPRLVCERCPWARMGFFLHTPFPQVRTFVELKYASALIDGVLGADFIELRTSEDVRNFVAAVNATRLFRTRNAVVDDNGRRVCVSAYYGESRQQAREIPQPS